MTILTLLFLFQTVETVMTFLNPFLAIAAPFVIQFIKNQLKLTGNGAVLATVGVSVSLAVIGLWVTGGLAAISAATLATTIFTVATLVYKFFITNESVQKALPETFKN